MRSRRLFQVVGIPILLVGLAGCNPTSGKSDVSGEVRFQGQPLDQGTIQFFPEEGGAPEGVSGITNGKYALPKGQGLLPGRYRIVISSGDAAQIETPAMPGESGPPAKERIPAEYNRDSLAKPVIRQVTSGDNKIDFDIP